MKKILFIISFLAIAGISQGQVTNQTLKSQYTNAEDTITSAVKYLTSTDLGVGGFKSFSVMANYIEISGTTAGTAKLQYSLDGSIWSTLPTDSVFTAGDFATNSYMWSYYGYRVFRYLRVAFTPSGTMSDKVYAKLTAVR